jgi:FtsP/CotA-like multicopper oxidase with cupredoxin domain
MTVERLQALDLLIGVLAAFGWLGAGAVAARRPAIALALSATAVLATLGRIGSILALAGHGWWFVQEKVTLAVPILGVTGLAAVLLAVPRLVRAVRSRRAAGHTAPVDGATVPLLTAGYAAAAGPVVTLLIGYPVDWSVALVTVALVGAAALLTSWVVAPEKAVPARRAGLAVTVAAGLVGAGLAVGSGPADAGPVAGHPGHTGGGVAVTSLRGPTAPAGSAVRRFELTARTATVTLSSGRRVPAWTFNGQLPGPQLTVRQGDLVEVRLRNLDISAGVTLHWHGYDVPSGEDGVPGLTQDAVLPGQEFVYRFRADQVGSYWYHTHEVSDRGVRMGLYGALVVTPSGLPEPGLDLTLPVHNLAGGTVLGDRDQVDVRRLAPGTPVRLRLVNTDNTPRRFTLAGTGYRLVAVDGDDLHGPGELTRAGLRLAAGGRYDLSFVMPDAPVALLVGDDRSTGLRLLPPGAAEPAPAEDTAGWPELDLTRYGTPTGTPFGADSRFDKRFTLVLDRGLALVDGRPRYAHTVNGRGHPAIPTEVVREGDLVRFTVVNRGRDTHPWHLHGHRVLVLTRDGHPVTGSPLWLDTFDVRPGEVWQVAFRATNPGLWMNHCHNLSHADQGMMLHLAYEGVRS